MLGRIEFARRTIQIFTGDNSCIRFTKQSEFARNDLSFKWNKRTVNERELS